MECISINGWWTLCCQTNKISTGLSHIKSSCTKTTKKIASKAICGLWSAANSYRVFPVFLWESVIVLFSLVFNLVFHAIGFKLYYTLSLCDLLFLMFCLFAMQRLWIDVVCFADRTLSSILSSIIFCIISTKRTV